MRKWRCVKSNSIYFTIGKIYETDENGDGLTDNSSSNKSWTNPWRFRLGGINGASFEEVFNKVKEEEKKMDKFKIGDVVEIIGNCNEHGYRIGEKVKLYKEYDFNFHNVNGNGFFAERLDGTKIFTNIIRTKDMKHSSNNTKTLTITTSDTRTTITDGTHTTSINRYYTDKHNERNAVSIVIDKYYEELAEIERVSKLPKVGDKVKVVNKELTYDTYKQWLVKNNISIESALKWSNGELPKNGMIFEIIMIVENHVLIENDRECFLVDIKGLEVIK